jgi:hypothetical protein
MDERRRQHEQHVKECQKIAQEKYPVAWKKFQEQEKRDKAYHQQYDKCSDQHPCHDCSERNRY